MTNAKRPFTGIDQLYIDGAWHPVDDRQPVLNPPTEEVIGTAPVGNAATTD